MEKHFGETDPNPLWIKFFSIDSECWIGSFASGDIGLVNNIEEVKSETEGLVKALNHGTAILNYDDPRVKEMDKVVSQNCNITYLSMDPETLTNIEKSEKITVPPPNHENVTDVEKTIMELFNAKELNKG